MHALRAQTRDQLASVSSCQLQKAEDMLDSAVIFKCVFISSVWLLNCYIKRNVFTFCLYTVFQCCGEIHKKLKETCVKRKLCGVLMYNLGVIHQDNKFVSREGQIIFLDACLALLLEYCNLHRLMERYKIIIKKAVSCSLKTLTYFIRVLTFL